MGTESAHQKFLKFVKKMSTSKKFPAGQACGKLRACPLPKKFFSVDSIGYWMMR
jgi:hypothetical protein